MPCHDVRILPCCAHVQIKGHFVSKTVDGKGVGLLGHSETPLQIGRGPFQYLDLNSLSSVLSSLQELCFERQV